MSTLSHGKSGVVIVGASVAGCAAAIRFAQANIPVTLVEKRGQVEAHKPICTHFIQPCSVPAWKKLGLYDDLTAAGAIKNTIAISTKWGWIENAPIDEQHAFNVRRVTLDPLIRQRAIATPGVTYLPGVNVDKVNVVAGRVVGISGRRVVDGAQVDLACELLVAADGRESEVAHLAGVRQKEWENQRFSCFGFFQGIPEESRSMSRMWMLEPYIAYQFPNDGDTTLIALMPTKDRMADFKVDRDRNFREIVRALPDAPDIDNAIQVGEYRLNSRNSLLVRSHPPAGMALIGDAFMTSDPLHGFGISWGVMSAIDLVDELSSVFHQGSLRAIDRSLARYHSVRRRELWGHFKIMIEMAGARPMIMPQQILFSAATRDQKMASIIQRFLAGQSGTQELLSPITMARAIAVNAKHALRKRMDWRSNRVGKQANSHFQ